MLNQKTQKNHNNSTQLIIVNSGAHYVDLMFRWKFCEHTNAFTEIHLQSKFEYVVSYNNLALVALYCFKVELF